MSCVTASAQIVRLTVTAGNLPEGYCPESYQQFANDFAARLIVTPNQANTTFVQGSVEPTSNVGPWFKDCMEWFFFDDATGRYRPMYRSGFSAVQVFDASGTFTVPDNIYKLYTQAWGGGGGGGDRDPASIGGSGGGGGGYGSKIFDVSPGQVIVVTVGAGGAGGSPGAAGGNTTFLTLTATGGAGGVIGTGPIVLGGAGGTSSGNDIQVNGQYGETSLNFAGGPPGGQGGDAGVGGAGGRSSTVAASTTGKAPGGGGSGGGNTASGLITAGAAGASGRIIVWY